MKKATVFVCAALVMVAGTLSMPPAAQTQAPQTQDVRALLQAVSKNIGADNLNTLEYTGSGMVAAPGQGFDPIPVLIGVPESWPRFAVTNYTMTIDYATMSSRESYTRTSPEPPGCSRARLGGGEHGNQSDPPFKRGGGGHRRSAPRQIDARQQQDVAWDVTNNKPARQWEYLSGIDTGEYRQLEIILTPHGFVKAALAPGANPYPRARRRRRAAASCSTTCSASTRSSARSRTTSFRWWRRGSRTRSSATCGSTMNNASGRISAASRFWTEDHSHFVEATQQDNRQFRILNARANVRVAPETFAVPRTVQQATRPAVRVQSRQLRAGVWLLGGGSHNSVLVEFRNFVAVVEAPQNDERSHAVVAEVRRLVPNKPIRYVVNTHYHWDHSGGLRGLVAAGAQIVTHERNAEYYGRMMFGTRRRLMPDSLSQREELLGTSTEPQYRARSAISRRSSTTGGRSAPRLGGDGVLQRRHRLAAVVEPQRVLSRCLLAGRGDPHQRGSLFAAGARARTRRRRRRKAWSRSGTSSARTI